MYFKLLALLQGGRSQQHLAAGGEVEGQCLARSCDGDPPFLLELSFCVCVCVCFLPDSPTLRVSKKGRDSDLTKGRNPALRRNVNQTSDGFKPLDEGLVKLKLLLGGLLPFVITLSFWKGWLESPHPLFSLKSSRLYRVACPNISTSLYH